MTLCDVAVNTDIWENPAAFVVSVVMAKIESTSEGLIVAYKTTRRHIQDYNICVVTPVRSSNIQPLHSHFSGTVIDFRDTVRDGGPCELFLDCYRINVFLLFNISYTLLVAFPHQRADSLEWSVHRLNLCSAAGETVICRIVGSMTSK